MLILFGVLALSGYVTVQASCGSSSHYTTHGDIRCLHPTGQHSGVDPDWFHPTGQHSGGVAASQHDVDLDYSWLSNKKSCYDASGSKYGVQPSVIAAIADRETRGGKLIQHTGGWGDHHHTLGYGIMQCDIRYHSCTDHAWDSCLHIDQMVREVLVPYINQVAHKHPTWTQDQALQGGIAAYNSGVGNIQTVDGMDRGTTGNDYSNDVAARAQYLISHYNWH